MQFQMSWSGCWARVLSPKLGAGAWDWGAPWGDLAAWVLVYGVVGWLGQALDWLGILAQGANPGPAETLEGSGPGCSQIWFPIPILSGPR